MQRSVASEVEREELIIRRGVPTSRPHTPLQSPWQGPLPHGVKAIVEREALDRDYSKSYAKWASSFALLTDDFISDVVKSTLKGAARPLEWTCFKFIDCCCCQVGENYLWMQRQDSGWTIELCYPDKVDPDARVLTIQNMPVLCPDRASAAWLAQASYPTEPANMLWHSYW
jgi:hypothetical protein